MEPEVIEDEPKPGAQLPVSRETIIAVQTAEQTLQAAALGSNAALAAQMVASIQARYLMAERHPRDLVKVEAELEMECQDPAFAKLALYRKPVGLNPDGTKKYIEGLSVRFAEIAVRAMGNIFCGSMVVSQDSTGRVVRVVANDLERNIYYDKDIPIKSTVERRSLKRGETAISSRLNSEGQMVYTKEATEDEIEVKTAQFIAKVQRNLSLKLVPPKIKIKCEQMIREILLEEAKRELEEKKKQPAAVRLGLVDAFASKGVSDADLATYIGHPIDTITAEEMVELRAIFLAIVEGDASWAEIVEVTRTPGTPAAPTESGLSKSAEEILSKLEARRLEVVSR